MSNGEKFDWGFLLVLIGIGTLITFGVWWAATTWDPLPSFEHHHNGLWFATQVCPQTNPSLPFEPFFEQCAAEVKAREVQLRSVTIVNSVESTPSACVEVWPARHDGSCNIADRP